jgi:hypothetical protein
MGDLKAFPQGLATPLRLQEEKAGSIQPIKTHVIDLRNISIPCQQPIANPYLGIS